MKFLKWTAISDWSYETVWEVVAMSDSKFDRTMKKNTVIEILKLLEGYSFSDSEAILNSSLGILRGISITKLPDDIFERLDSYL